jgi:hypothetical protein
MGLLEEKSVNAITGVSLLPIATAVLAGGQFVQLPLLPTRVMSQ